MSNEQYFPSVSEIKYEGPDSKNPLAFKWYDPDKKVGGKTMKEHLRFGIAYWHTLCGAGQDIFGSPTFDRAWNSSSDVKASAEAKMHAAFEFFQKIGAEYYCFHDADVIAEADTLAESNERIDFIADLLEKKQQETGIKLLWNTSNLFSHPRFMHGAATNPDADVVAFAGGKVKKMLEVGKKLGAENYVFWGGREGYDSLMNTDMKRELDHLAAFLSMAVDYAKSIDFGAQFLIEPKAMEPTKHQYDHDAATCLSFLREYNLTDHFKLNIEANHATLAGHSFDHELIVASNAGLLGSVDANRGDVLLGWDTDQFAVDFYETSRAMLVILKQGGLGSGGLNFDAKLRRTSTDIEDLFIGHIGSMDAFAFGLLAADKYMTRYDEILSKRYQSFDSGIGKDIESGSADLAALEAHATKIGKPETISGKQEFLENEFNDVIVDVIRGK